MNKFKTDVNGGISFEWNDFRWEQDSVREAFFGLISAFGIDPADSFILSGCIVTPNGSNPANKDNSAGYLCLNGEVFKVDTLSDVSGPYFYWEIVESYDPSGDESLQNGSIEGTYLIRRARLTGYSSAQSGLMPYDSSTLANKIQTIISSQDIYILKSIEAWKVVGSAGQPIFLNGWTNSIAAPVSLAFRKNQLGQLTIRGNLRNAAFDNSKVQICTLPAGYIPESLRALSALIINVGAIIGTTVYLDASGNLYSGNLNTAGDTYILIPEQCISLD